MSGADPVPELLQAEWSADQVLALFADLAAGAEIEHVQMRMAGADARVSLVDAQNAFAAGTARAIQVRYRFEGELWCDTIMPGAVTTNIIRSRLPEL